MRKLIFILVILFSIVTYSQKTNTGINSTKKISKGQTLLYKSKSGVKSSIIQVVELTPEPDMITVSILNEKPIEIDIYLNSIVDDSAHGNIIETTLGKDGTLIQKVTGEGYEDGEYMIYKFPDPHGKNNKLESYYMGFDETGKLVKSDSYYRTIKKITYRHYNNEEQEVYDSIQEQESNDKKQLEQGTRLEKEENQKNNDSVYTSVKSIPHFVNKSGYWSDFSKYVEDKLSFTKEEINYKVSGEISAQFIVEKDGQISDVKILKGVNSNLDEQVLKILKAKNLSRLIPAKNGDIIVRYIMTLPIKIGDGHEQSQREIEYNQKQYEVEQEKFYNEYHSKAEIEPTFPGGMKALDEYLYKNFNLPFDYVNTRINVEFIIEKDGSLSHPSGYRYQDGNGAIDRKIKKVLDIGPKWSPASQNGRTLMFLLKLMYDVKTQKWVMLNTNKKGEQY